MELIQKLVGCEQLNGLARWTDEDLTLFGAISSRIVKVEYDVEVGNGR